MDVASNEPLSRREILDGFRAGERAALELVYRQHAPDVARFLRHGFTVGKFRFAGYFQPFDLDNAMQETFARAFRPAARLGYDGLRSYSGYLCGIARNFVIDELRSRRMALEPFVQEMEGGGPPIEEEVLRGDLGRLYARFLDGLNTLERSFFVLRFEEQRTQVEAGRACGLSHMQSRTREKKLRARFVECLQAGGYAEKAATVARDGVALAV